MINCVIIEQKKGAKSAAAAEKKLATGGQISRELHVRRGDTVQLSQDECRYMSTIQ